MEAQLRTPPREELHERAAQIRLAVFDVDGVLTDGGLYYGPSGEALKRFDVKDGHALVLAREAGLSTAILTARRSDIVEVRARELGVGVVKQGRREKGLALEEILSELGIPAAACAYVGDDLNDLPAMAKVALPCCPSDAVPEVRAQALFVAQSPGGRGAVREVIELCLKASRRWEYLVKLFNR